MRKLRLALAACLALTACETASVGPSAPAGPPTIPDAALDLGDWRHASAEAEFNAFQQTIAHRYGVGLQVSAVAADLRRAQFVCAANRDTQRGDPPAQICRKTVTENGCTHTWQVHLFDTAGNALLARTRGLYDRRCGGDGLLGGPS
ncbi:MAG: hypothetical protein ABUL73_06390 [Alphaproteobacteria bacterium]